MIGHQAEQTVEYTVTHKDGGPFYVEKDGVLIFTAVTADEALAATKRNARVKGHKRAGLTEAFGRNRQFILSPRGAWKRHKEA